MKKVRKGFGFNSTFVDVEEAKDKNSKTTGAIECADCGDIFYTKDISKENSAMSCSCKNIRITLGKFYAPQPGRSEHYILLHCTRSKTKIYDVIKETLEPVQPYKEY